MVFILFKLPGKAAKRVADLGAEVLTRFIGGDLTLADEVRVNHDEQRRLAEEDPTHEARLFGQAVEASQADPIPKALLWRPERIDQKQHQKDFDATLKQVGLGTPRTYAMTNNAKNQAVIGFTCTTKQFQKERLPPLGIPVRTPLTECMDVEQLAGHRLMSHVLKRKVCETSNIDDNKYASLLAETHSILKDTFHRLGMHEKPLEHHEKQVRLYEVEQRRIERQADAEKRRVELQKEKEQKRIQHRAEMDNLRAERQAEQQKLKIEMVAEKKKQRLEENESMGIRMFFHPVKV